MTEYSPIDNESEDKTEGILDDESRRDFMRGALGVVAGGLAGAFVPAAAEGGILSSSVLKAAAARAALKSAERRIATDEHKPTLPELERVVATTRAEYEQKLNAYIQQNLGKTESDYHKTHEGVEYYNKWVYANIAVRDYKK